jgi:hypothetical protein
MSTQAARSVQASSLSLTPNWLWTWNGVCFGYRLGDSLFTHEGIEVGRFSGTEVYDPDGGYLGELRRADDGDRLITGSYKKSRTGIAFIPALERPRKRPGDRIRQPLYCGYEDFPSPEVVKGMIMERGR